MRTVGTRAFRYQVVVVEKNVSSEARYFVNMNELFRHCCCEATKLALKLGKAADVVAFGFAE